VVFFSGESNDLTGEKQNKIALKCNLRFNHIEKFTGVAQLVE